MTTPNTDQQRPTPRTDANLINVTLSPDSGSGDVEQYVSPDFARELEREVQGLMEALEQCHYAIREAMDDKSWGSLVGRFEKSAQADLMKAEASARSALGR